MKKKRQKFSKKSASYLDVMEAMMKNIEEMAAVMKRTIDTLDILDKRLKRIEGVYAKR